MASGLFVHCGRIVMLNNRVNTTHSEESMQEHIGEHTLCKMIFNCCITRALSPSFIFFFFSVCLQVDSQQAITLSAGLSHSLPSPLSPLRVCVCLSVCAAVQQHACMFATSTTRSIMEVKERRPYCSLTKGRKDKEGPYTGETAARSWFIYSLFMGSSVGQSVKQPTCPCMY